MHYALFTKFMSINSIKFRLIGAAGRFSVILLAPIILDSDNYVQYALVYSVSLIVSHIFSFDLYHYYHRYGDISDNKFATLSDHFSVLTTIWVIGFLIGVFFYVVQTSLIFYIFLLSISMSCFSETYRYTGVLNNQIIGHKSYAIRGTLAALMTAVVWVVNNGKFELLITSLALIDIACLVYVFVKANYELKLKLPKFPTFTALNKLRFVLPSTIISRLLANIDRAFIIPIFFLGVSERYLFTSMVAATLVNLIEPILLNRYIRASILNTQDRTKLFHVYRIAAILTFVLTYWFIFCVKVTYMPEIQMSEAFFLSAAGSIILASNAYYLRMYGNKQDDRILFSNIIVIIGVFLSIYIFYVFFKFNELYISILVFIMSLLIFITRQRFEALK